MDRRALRLMIIAALALGSAIAVAPSPAGAGPAEPSGPAGTSTPNPGLDDFFQSVSAVSSSDVWAAGYYGNNNTGNDPSPITTHNQRRLSRCAQALVME